MFVESSLYALPYERELTSPEREALISILGDECRRRVGSYHYFADQDRSILGEYLCKHMLSKYSGVPFDEIGFKRTSYGKPVWNGHDSLFFNISHSNRWIICGISSYPIGVDIEHIKPVSLENMSSALSAKERALLTIMDDYDRSFYRIWSAKESYLKAIGKGLAISPETVEFDPLEKQWNQTVEGMIPDTKEYGVDSAYICQATVLHGSAPKTILNVRDLLF